MYSWEEGAKPIASILAMVLVVLAALVTMMIPTPQSLDRRFCFVTVVVVVVVVVAEKNATVWLETTEVAAILVEK